MMMSTPPPLGKRAGLFGLGGFGADVDSAMLVRGSCSGIRGAINVEKQTNMCKTHWKITDEAGSVDGMSFHIENQTNTDKIRKITGIRGKSKHQSEDDGGI
jgi:hypothetical protein